MRLINTSTFTLHEFFGTNIPEYCILSHRWETEEVTFQDLQAGRGPKMQGYSKIVGCCKQAVLDGWDYAWINSCCIDKTSSAELSEAINSICLWYSQSQVCFAFLSDVPSIEHRSDDATRHYLSKSKWFTRGWTFQELLAPVYVVFYDKNWEEIGTTFSLTDVIQSITGIRDLRRWKESCVAQKMSWASKRETTRIEDMAYSLLGLFGVYMPPLYVSVSSNYNFKISTALVEKTISNKDTMLVSSSCLSSEIVIDEGENAFIRLQLSKSHQQI